MTTFTYPTVGFHFLVTFTDIAQEGDDKKISFKPVDVRFQSVAGLDVQMETESWKEGGENRFAHEMPTKTKFSSSITLKRALVGPKDSGLTDWCTEAFINLKVRPMSVVSVDLLDQDHNVLFKWDLHHVWPKSWKIAEFNAERSEVLIETLELNYNRFTYKNLKSGSS